MSFDEAYQRAYTQTCPNGLDEIQQETILLVNYSKIVLLKRVTYSIGFLSSLSLLVSFVFFVMHFPGKELLATIGSWGLLGLHIPMLLFSRYKAIARRVASKQLVKHPLLTHTTSVIGVLAFLFFSIGITLMAFNQEFGVVLFLVSLLIFTPLFLPFLFLKMYKKSLVKI